MKVFAGLLALGVLMPVGASAQEINRLAAKFTRFDGFELLTSLTPSSGGAGGITIFSKSVFVSATLSQTPILYVTISATGDGHSGAAHALTALLDGTPFNNGRSAALGITGWIPLQRHNGVRTVADPQGSTVTIPFDDLHDNNINYTWCVVATPGSHTVSVKLASSNGGTVFLESAHFYIDASAPSGVDACSSF